MNNEVRIYDRSSDVATFFKENNVKVVKMGSPDTDGLWRGKRIMADYFLKSVAASGSNICNILFGWDLQDEMIPTITYTGWHTGYPDITLLPDLDTLHIVPGEVGVAAVICDFVNRDGSDLEIAPRTILKNLINRSEKLGYTPIAAYEFEFYLLKGAPNDNAKNDWLGLEPYSFGNHTYSVWRDTGSDYIIGEIRDRLAEVGVFIEASNSEHGAGQFEVNIHYGEALKAADHAMLLKNTVKEIAAKHGYTATFMAKYKQDQAGSSGHVHQSLNHVDTNEAAFKNPEDPLMLSDVGMKYLAGCVLGARDFTALYLPNINSYKRVEGGQWAGSSSTWGYDNRTVSMRSIPDAGPAARIENRIAGADSNPYLVIAATLASGLMGIEDKLTAPDPIEGNAYDLDADESLRLPNSLEKAVDIWEESEIAKRYFGEKFVKHYAQTRRWEIHTDRTTVSDWEIARYLEHI